jgi:acid phosphatase family membrane protein YuiD
MLCRWVSSAAASARPGQAVFIAAGVAGGQARFMAFGIALLARRFADRFQFFFADLRRGAGVPSARSAWASAWAASVAAPAAASARWRSATANWRARRRRRSFPSA